MSETELFDLGVRFASATAALAAWQREHVLPDDATVAAAEALFAAVAELADQIMAQQPETIAGLAVQARVAACLHNESDDGSLADCAAATVVKGVVSLAANKRM